MEEGSAHLGDRDQLEHIFWRTEDLSDALTLRADGAGTGTILATGGEDLVQLHDITVVALEAATGWLLPYS